ncbi:MAG TPA: Asp23/Gls24 family envelope stress response protein [bacterium]|nr:Asp23/Gls24 family envelope stress response protein [bacterium]HQL60926.1 Asp23/Gls24 family envelope stress response protein [bacterium]
MNGYYMTENGRVSIAPNILKSFVIKELEGSSCFRLCATRGEGLGEYFGKRSLDNSIRVSFTDSGRANISLNLQVLFGTRIRLKARELQGRIARAIALGTGLDVEDVSITVDRVYCEPEILDNLVSEPTQSSNIDLDEG